MSAKNTRVVKTPLAPEHADGAGRVPRDPAVEEMLGLYYYVSLARAVDERMWALQRSGKAAFVISGQGHEGAQVGTAYALDRERDWLVPFYRSVGSVLVKGMPPAELFLIQLGKSTGPQQRWASDARPLWALTA